MAKPIYEMFPPNMFVTTTNNGVEVFCVVNTDGLNDKPFVRVWRVVNDESILCEVPLADFFEEFKVHYNPIYLAQSMDVMLYSHLGELLGVDLNCNFYKIHYERVRDELDSSENALTDEFFEEEKSKSVFNKVGEWFGKFFNKDDKKDKFFTTHSFKGRVFKFFIEQIDIKKFDVGLIFKMLEQKIPDIYKNLYEPSIIQDIFPQSDYNNYNNKNFIMSYKEFMMYLKGSEEFLYKISTNFTILQCRLFNKGEIFYWLFCSELLRPCFDKNHQDYDSKAILPRIDNIAISSLSLMFLQDEQDSKTLKRYRLFDKKSEMLFEVTDKSFLREIQRLSNIYKLWAVSHTIKLLLESLKTPVAWLKIEQPILPKESPNFLITDDPAENEEYLSKLVVPVNSQVVLKKQVQEEPKQVIILSKPQELNVLQVNQQVNKEEDFITVLSAEDLVDGSGDDEMQLDLVPFYQEDPLLELTDDMRKDLSPPLSLPLAVNPTQEDLNSKQVFFVTVSDSNNNKT